MFFFSIGAGASVCFGSVFLGGKRFVQLDENDRTAAAAMIMTEAASIKAVIFFNISIPSIFYYDAFKSAGDKNPVIDQFVPEMDFYRLEKHGHIRKFLQLGSMSS